MKKLLVISALCICLVGCSKTAKPSQEKTPDVPVETPIAETTGFNQTIEVGGFELTFGSEATIELIENQFSTQDGKELVSIPVHVKNISGSTGAFNMFYYKTFGPSGSELEKFATSFFKEDALGMDGDLRNQAEKESKLYMLYDGDGHYFVEFNDFKVKLEIKFDVKK